jgi:proline iminopeptidase
MLDRFPAIEPYASGMLDVGDGHEIYWEACGNPSGKPALYLHGGPGSGFSPGQRRFFDPKAYRIVLFDQRGSGRSRPLASDSNVDMTSNTTQHLIADIERLRLLHSVEKWTILGMSWGTTLGLAYAQAHPQNVESLVLALVTTTSQSEVEWITEGVGKIFPHEWDRFISAIPERLKHLRPVDAYAEMLFDSDPAFCDFAAREWCAWEDAHVSLGPGHKPSPRSADAEFRLRVARLVTHYWRNHAFLGENQLVQNAPVLNGIRGVLIHGRYDVSSPLETAWKLSKSWTSSRLEVLENAGHGGGDDFIHAVINATNQFANA